MRILQVEDDRITARGTELMLKSEGFNVYTADLGEEGVDLAKLYDYDAITLDLNLPDIGGLEVLRQVRAAKITTPVIILTGASDLAVKLTAFNLGADDYLTKPFHRDELVARLHALIRRSKGIAQTTIAIGPIEININAKQVHVSGQPVHFTGREYQCLELLALRQGAVITKEMFLNHLYGGMDEPELKIIDVFICKVRRKIKDAAGANYIRTVWGRGYCLTDEPVAIPLTSFQTSPVALVPPAEQIILALADGERTFLDLVSRTAMTAGAARNRLSQVMRGGFVGNVGSYKHGVYALTASGRKRLAAIQSPRGVAA